jgi:hypothetical protein
MNTHNAHNTHNEQIVRNHLIINDFSVTTPDRPSRTSQGQAIHLPPRIELLSVAPKLVFESADFLSHGKWIELRQLLFEFVLFFSPQVATVDEKLRGGATFLFMSPDLATALPSFALLLHRNA